jgi:hypothetical protein
VRSGVERSIACRRIHFPGFFRGGLNSAPGRCFFVPYLYELHVDRLNTAHPFIADGIKYTGLKTGKSIREFF